MSGLREPSWLAVLGKLDRPRLGTSPAFHLALDFPRGCA